MKMNDEDRKLYDDLCERINAYLASENPDPQKVISLTASFVTTIAHNVARNCNVDTDRVLDDLLQVCELILENGSFEADENDNKSTARLTNS